MVFNPPDSDECGSLAALLGHLVRDEGVAGANPASPTRIQKQNQDLYDRAEDASALGDQLWAQIAHAAARSASPYNSSNEPSARLGMQHLKEGWNKVRPGGTERNLKSTRKGYGP